MAELIGEAMGLGLQGLAVLGLVLFAQSFYQDLANFCSGKDGR